MEPPTTPGVSGDPMPPSMLTAALHQPANVDDLGPMRRAAQAARVLRAALQAAGLERIAVHVTAGSLASTVCLPSLEPADARELAAFINRSLLAGRR
jgi:hypothetical protein